MIPERGEHSYKTREDYRVVLQVIGDKLLKSIIGEVNARKF